MWTPKRFYKSAETGQLKDGFAVLLDGRTVKTPSGTPLIVPTQELAHAIALEWDAQDEEIRPETMPAQQLAVTAIDGVGRNRVTIVEEILTYAGTDLLCYRAVEPDDLVDRQQEVWQPLLDWARDATGAQFVVTQGVVPVDQPPEAATAFRKIVEAFNDFEIAVLSNLTVATGSMVIALAVMDGRIDGEEAFSASQLDESYQIEKWGEDDEAAARRANLHHDILAADRFLRLIRTSARTTGIGEKQNDTGKSRTRRETAGRRL